jgi:hypothetical protein
MERSDMTDLIDDALSPGFIGRRGHRHPVPKESVTMTANRLNVTVGEMAGIFLVPALAVLLAYAVATVVIGA